MAYERVGRKERDGREEKEEGRKDEKEENKDDFRFVGLWHPSVAHSKKQARTRCTSVMGTGRREATDTVVSRSRMNLRTTVWVGRRWRVG